MLTLAELADNLLSRPMLAFLGGLGPWEIVLIVAVVLILFGGRKIPELAKGLGRGLREFKREMHGVKRDFNEAIEAIEEDEPEYTEPRRKKKRKKKVRREPPVESIDEEEEPVEVAEGDAGDSDASEN